MTRPYEERLALVEKLEILADMDETECGEGLSSFGIALRYIEYLQLDEAGVEQLIVLIETMIKNVENHYVNQALGGAPEEFLKLNRYYRASDIPEVVIDDSWAPSKDASLLIREMAHIIENHVPCWDPSIPTQCHKEDNPALMCNSCRVIHEFKELNLPPLKETSK